MIRISSLHTKTEVWSTPVINRWVTGFLFDGHFTKILNKNMLTVEIIINMYYITAHSTRRTLIRQGIVALSIMPNENGRRFIWLVTKSNGLACLIATETINSGSFLFLPPPLFFYSY